MDREEEREIDSLRHRKGIKGSEEKRRERD